MPDGQRKYLGSNIFSFGEVEVPAPDADRQGDRPAVVLGLRVCRLRARRFDSSMLTEEDAPAPQKPAQPRLLAVNNELVVPVDTTVRVQVTADPTA